MRLPRLQLRFRPGCEQLETRNVLATSVAPVTSVLSQVVIATPTAVVTIQVVQTQAFVNSSAVSTTPAAASVSPLDVPSAVQNIASSTLAQAAGASTARVVVVVTPQTGLLVVALPVASSFAAAGAATAGNEQQPTTASPATAQPLPPSVVVPNPLINFPRIMWVSDTPQARPSNYPEGLEQIPEMPEANNPAPANPAPQLPPLPPIINIPIPLAQADYSEPRVVVAAVADENLTQPMEQRLEAPTLPPTTAEEETSPSPAVAGLAMALLGFPCAVATERQKREFYHDRRREKWPWVW
jgi:hypothetical protein